MTRPFNDYEPVKQRKLRFFKEYPDGRIIPELINPDAVSSHALFKASIYCSRQDQEKDLPLAVGFAHEVRDKELKKTREGKLYESVNYTSWVENCEESAVGRALDNAGFASNAKCSREEIEKAKRQKELFQKVQNAQKIFWVVVKRLTNDFKDTDSLVDIYKFLGVKNGEEIKAETDVKIINEWITRLNEYCSEDGESDSVVQD